jgi:hypothetical protein
MDGKIVRYEYEWALIKVRYVMNIVWFRFV